MESVMITSIPLEAPTTGLPSEPKILALRFLLRRIPLKALEELLN